MVDSDQDVGNRQNSPQKKPIDPHLVVVFTGAGVSSSSGIPVYWDGDISEHGKRAHLIANVNAWRSDPARVLEHYNHQRSRLSGLIPSLAHYAIADLERFYRVVVITQNIDDLHERAGSSEVYHLHGELCWSRSDVDPRFRVFQGYQPIRMGDVAPDGHQLRPDVVWFGERVHYYNLARNYIRMASKVLAVGTSLQVQPAASLLKKARFRADKILISNWVAARPYGYWRMHGEADECVPIVVNEWIARRV